MHFIKINKSKKSLVVTVTWEMITAQNQQQQYRPIHSSERALQNNKQQLSKRKYREGKIGHGVPDGSLTPIRTG
jgi:hypothetical protein